MNVENGGMECWTAQFLGIAIIIKIIIGQKIQFRLNMLQNIDINTLQFNFLVLKKICGRHMIDGYFILFSESTNLER